jgi:hypothetical protein
VLAINLALQPGKLVWGRVDVGLRRKRGGPGYGMKVAHARLSLHRTFCAAQDGTVSRQDERPCLARTRDKSQATVDSGQVPSYGGLGTSPKLRCSPEMVPSYK